MNLFRTHHVQFQPVDPLGDGLGEAIAAERQEANAINSLEDTSADELVSFWDGVVKDIEKDPSWFDFSKE